MMKASRVQQLAPTRAISWPKFGTCITIIPVIDTRHNLKNIYCLVIDSSLTRESSLVAMNKRSAERCREAIKTGNWLPAKKIYLRNIANTDPADIAIFFSSIEVTGNIMMG